MRLLTLSLIPLTGRLAGLHEGFYHEGFYHAWSKFKFESAIEPTDLSFRPEGFVARQRSPAKWSHRFYRHYGLFISSSYIQIIVLNPYYGLLFLSGGLGIMSKHHRWPRVSPTKRNSSSYSRFFLNRQSASFLIQKKSFSNILYSFKIRFSQAYYEMRKWAGA